MKNNILITTTNSIENAEIEKYFGIVSTNIVVGTNLFADFGASLTDIFGGNSEIYKGKLGKIYKMAIEEIQSKANLLGANAILGLKIEFDEISGKGKSMFMVSAIGTGVRIKYNEVHKQEVASTLRDSVSLEQLQNEQLKREIISLLESKALLNKNHWEYLFSNPTNEIADLLLIYFNIYSQQYLSEFEKNIVNNTMAYFKLIDYDYAINLLYADLNEKTDIKILIIKDAELFSPIKIIELLDQNQIKIAIKCLETNKETYNKDDLDNMKIIINKLDNLPQTGKMEKSKGMFSSKDKEDFICQNNHKNSSNIEYCETCHLNIFGLKEKEVQIINNFKQRAEALECLIK